MSSLETEMVSKKFKVMTSSYLDTGSHVSQSPYFQHHQLHQSIPPSLSQQQHHQYSINQDLRLNSQVQIWNDYSNLPRFQNSEYNNFNDAFHTSLDRRFIKDEDNLNTLRPNQDLSTIPLHEHHHYQQQITDSIQTPNYSYNDTLHSINTDRDIDGCYLTSPEVSIYGESVCNEMEGENFDLIIRNDNTETSQESNSKMTDQGWVNPLLTPIEPLSFDLDEVYSHHRHHEERSGSTQAASVSTSSPKTVSIKQEDHPISINEIIPKRDPTVIKSNKLIKPEITLPSPDQLEKKLTIKKRKPIIRTFKNTSCKEFDSIPIAEQLRSNKKIWTKICTVKKKGIYKCTHCPQMFNDLIQLSEHIDQFKIIRPYKCPFDDCAWSIIGLPRRAELRRHCSAQHEYVFPFPNKDGNSSSIDGDVPLENQTTETFHCNYDLCERIFKRKDSYKRHEKLVHLNPSSRFNKRIGNLKRQHKTTDVDKLAHIMERKSRPVKLVKIRMTDFSEVILQSEDLVEL